MHVGGWCLLAAGLLVLWFIFGDFLVVGGSMDTLSQIGVTSELSLRNLNENSCLLETLM